MGKFLETDSVIHLKLENILESIPIPIPIKICDLLIIQNYHPPFLFCEEKCIFGQDYLINDQIQFIRRVLKYSLCLNARQRENDI